MTTSLTGPRSGLDKPSSCPLQHMFQLFYLSKASLVLHPLSFSLLVCCILSYVSKQFLDHQPTCSAWPRASPPHHRIHHATRHTSQMTCHFQSSSDLFHFISKHVKNCIQLINHVANGGFTTKSMCMIAI